MAISPDLAGITIGITHFMSAWVWFLHFVHDHIYFILVAGVLVLFFAFWVTMEGVRNTVSKDEIFRLRQRLYQLEREKNFANMVSAPIVMSSRWVRVGGAATTSDGGCLLLVEGTSPLQKRVMMTVRIDGLPSKRNTTMLVGQRLQLEGKSGVYSIELFGAEKHQARLAVSLMSHHLAHLQSES